MSEDIGFLSEVEKTVLGIREKDVQAILEDVKKADCIIPAGSGRSFNCLKIALSEMAKMNEGKTVITMDDPGFPGRTLEKAGDTLASRYKSVLLLVNSCSGSAEKPAYFATAELARYIESSKSQNFKIDMLTSKPDSPTAELAKKHGSLLVLRESQKGSKKEKFTRYGILNDTYELSSLITLQALAEALFKDTDAGWALARLREEMPKLKHFTQEVVRSGSFAYMLDAAETRANITLGGRGSSFDVAEMGKVRLNHVKRGVRLLTGEDHGRTYLAKRDAPEPTRGDLLILFSYSGETDDMRWLCNYYKERGAKVVSFIGMENSSLYKASDRSIVIKEGNGGGAPKMFYTRSAFSSSLLPMQLAERYRDRGIELDDDIMRKAHSPLE